MDVLACSMCFAERESFAFSQMCRGHGMCLSCMLAQINQAACDLALLHKGRGFHCMADGCEAVIPDHVIEFIGGERALNHITILRTLFRKRYAMRKNSDNSGV